MPQPYQQSVSEALASHKVEAAQGPTESEAAQRLEEHGPNQLVQRRGRGPWRILHEQLTATLILVLIAAAVLSA